MRILIAAGGTGGHIFPAMSLAAGIKNTKPESEIIFCIDKRIDAKLLYNAGYKYYLLEAPRMPYRFSVKWVWFLIMLCFSLLKSAKMLNLINPDIVVGFGAYISGPLLMQAKRQKRKVIIHEQNVVMGRANRILSKTADKIAVSFDNPQYENKSRIVLTGNPVRNELMQDLRSLDKKTAIELLGLEPGRVTILVTGGSLGSGIINSVFLQALKDLPDTVLNSLQIIHLTGKDKFDSVQSIYKGIRIKVKLYPFFERIGLIYKGADFAITRAGAGTIAELCLFSLPAILIPYIGAGAHQLDNARFLNERGAGLLIEEKQLTADILKKYILSLLNDRNKLGSMSKQLKSLARIDAAEKLADAVFE